MKKTLCALLISSLLGTSAQAWMNPVSPKDPSDYSLLGSIVAGFVVSVIVASPYLIVSKISESNNRPQVKVKTVKGEEETIGITKEIIDAHQIKEGDKLEVTPDKTGGALLTKDGKPCVYLTPAESNLSKNKQISR